MAYSPEVGEDGKDSGAFQQFRSNVEGTIAAAGGGRMGGPGMMGMGGTSAIAGGAMGGYNIGNRNNFSQLGQENSAWAASQPATAEQPAAQAAAPAAPETVKPTTTAPRITKHAHTASMGMSMPGPSFS